MASRFISEPAFSLPFMRQALSSCPTFSSSFGKALFPARTWWHCQAQAPLNPLSLGEGQGTSCTGAEPLCSPTDEDLQPIPSSFPLRQRQGALGLGEILAPEIGAHLHPLWAGCPAPGSCCWCWGGRMLRRKDAQEGQRNQHRAWGHLSLHPSTWGWGSWGGSPCPLHGAPSPCSPACRVLLQAPMGSADTGLLRCPCTARSKLCCCGSKPVGGGSPSPSSWGLHARANGSYQLLQPLHVGVEMLGNLCWWELPKGIIHVGVGCRNTALEQPAASRTRVPLSPACP